MMSLEANVTVGNQQNNVATMCSGNLPIVWQDDAWEMR
jgi:hypothetical protein